MNGLEERERAGKSDLLLAIRFVDGSVTEQPYDLEQAELLQEVMDWFRNPGRDKVFSLHVVELKRILMLQHSHIVEMEVFGYIEPQGRSARWYEHLLHKYKSWRVARALSRGGGRKHGNCQ